LDASFAAAASRLYGLVIRDLRADARSYALPPLRGSVSRIEWLAEVDWYIGIVIEHADG
jgi:hypothetical protein